MIHGQQIRHDQDGVDMCPCVKSFPSDLSEELYSGSSINAMMLGSISELEKLEKFSTQRRNIHGMRREREQMVSADRRSVAVVSACLLMHSLRCESVCV